MGASSKPVPNLIQGVSQQSAQQRRDSQCEAQFDCFNSPKDGAVARNGAELVKFYPGQDLSECFPYELIRGREEHYLVLVRGPDRGGMGVLDLTTGEPATVTTEGVGSYLTAPAPAESNFCAQTVDDYTFIANKSIVPGLAAARSTTRPREALIFFKAGAYSSTYAISVLWQGVTYRWLYQTPDNSTAANAPYIATNFLASIFYRAMTGVQPGGTLNGAVGSIGTGEAGTGVVVKDNSDGGSTNPDITDLGFSMAINGNLLRLWRNDGQNFTMDTSDSVGDTYLVSFKDTVRSFSELPKGGFEGFLLKVKAKPGQSENAADYWVEYVSNTATSGFWQERVAPDVPVLLDASTMPHALVNLSPGVFVFRPQVWSSRIAGDGVDSAKDPGFVGKPIKDLFFHKGRLAILTESTVDFSKARNVFSHFPDTVQTLLADAPIGLTLSASDTIALLRRHAKVDESLYLWAQGAQFKISAGQNPFKQDTVEADDSTAYEFAEQSNFARVGTTLYFATEPNEFATVRNLVFSQGKAAGDTDITSHISEYIPAGVRRLAPSDTGQAIFVRTDGAPNRLFLYNYLVQDRTVVQSAWNTWRFPVEKIIWASVYRMDLLMLVQRPDGAMLLKVPLSARLVDDEPGAEYRTRMDLRVPDTQCTVTYDGAAEETSISPPYAIPAGDELDFMVSSRTTTGAYVRGRGATILRRSTAGRLVVKGDWSTTPFYLGRRIRSERTESTFYLRSEAGVVPTDSITIREFNLRYAATGYTRVEVDIGAGRPTRKHETRHIKVGTAEGVSRPPIISSDVVRAVVDGRHDETTVTTINDSWLPSRWQTAEWRYEPVLRARVGQSSGQG
ncbi:phage nozzle protein [Methylobacterium marchantiae]|uniref:Phage tail protein n=1 Tax=Methylobacterium marchantiae TaxID=600331 RepID=A0ABW3X2P6_9HYPH|nr:hypothetical protein AIGOOFII_3490 [Methylobacterium marchantiae]